VRYVTDEVGEKYKKGVGPAKKWGISAVYYRQSSNIFVYQPISTKFHMKVALGTSHITTQERGQTTEKVEKNWEKSCLLIPRTLKFLLTNRFGPNSIRR
jgi:hypothetical protein